MHRLTSAIVVGVLFLTIAAPAALASIPTKPVRACCMRGSHHSCSHGVSNPASKTNFAAQCACDNCERTLATPAAQPQDAATVVAIAPQFTYLEEFYGESAVQQVVQAQPQRAPPIYSIQRVKSLGSRISSRIQRWTAAIWPL